MSPSLSCAECGFAGPAVEFLAACHDDEGDVVLVPLDEAGEVYSVMCVGCTSEWGRVAPDLIADLLRRLWAEYVDPEDLVRAHAVPPSVSGSLGASWRRRGQAVEAVAGVERVRSALAGGRF